MKTISTLLFSLSVCASVLYYWHVQTSTVSASNILYPEKPAFSQINLVGGFDWTNSDNVELFERNLGRNIVFVSNRGGGYFNLVFFTSGEPVVFSLRIPPYNPPTGNGTLISDIKLAEYQRDYSSQIMNLSKGFIREVMSFCSSTAKFDTTNLSLGFKEIQLIVNQPKYIDMPSVVYLQTDGCEDLYGRNECNCSKIQIHAPLYTIGWQNGKCSPGHVLGEFRTQNDFLDFLTLKK